MQRKEASLKKWGDSRKSGETSRNIFKLLELMDTSRIQLSPLYIKKKMTKTVEAE
jgi:hypothetical protein